MRTTLPMIPPVDTVIDRPRDCRYKAKMTSKKLRPHTLKVGDTVIVKQKKTNKLKPAFNPTPFRIIEVKGSTITTKEINGTATTTRE